MIRNSLSAWASVAMLACATEHADPVETIEPAPEISAAQPTYWQDMLPIFSENCIGCHREGGIAPFRLDDYASAQKFAALIASSTQQRTMPPWAVTSDGTCGEFADSLALSDAEIARIGAWARAGAPAGSPSTWQLPELAPLDAALEISTPEFVPESAGDALAEADEYRCFELPFSLSEQRFITGYEVVPGAPELVHHVMLALVDPSAPSMQDAARSNAQVLEALDAASPEREGWSCYGSVADGVRTRAFPAIWAPGQGSVRYPGGSGVPIGPHDKLIAQVHYNLRATSPGLRDQTLVRFALADHVDEIGLFIPADKLLASLVQGEPTTLPPRQPDTRYSWTLSFEELGLGALPELQLRGVMPHMHEYGRSFSMHLSTQGEAAECMAEVKHWDFHWQRMFFYEMPVRVTPESKLSVDCRYDTSEAQAPVQPGWGTRNEMCAAIMYVTMPNPL